MEDTLTKAIRAEIKNQYKSIRQFALILGMPQSTVVSALNNGIGGTSFDTVLKMCSLLNVKPFAFDLPAYLDGEAQDMLEAYAALDRQGRHTVDTILQVELCRCMGKPLENISRNSNSKPYFNVSKALLEPNGE